jgi:hypothetical protein
MIKKTNNTYIRPNQTHQELLSNQDIKDKLKDYKKIDDISSTSIGTHIRYFNIDPKTKTKLFRLGGFLNKIDPKKRFITLNNGNLSWSVQLSSSILYEKMSEDEIKHEIKEEIKKELLTEDNNQTGGTKNIIQLKNEIKVLNKKLENFTNLENNYNSLIKEYNILLKKNEFLNNKILKIEDEIIKNKNIK